jgi:hypothetical protein
MKTLPCFALNDAAGTKIHIPLCETIALYRENPACFLLTVLTQADNISDRSHSIG